jgi:hypothetical protein
MRKSTDRLSRFLLGWWLLAKRQMVENREKQKLQHLSYNN